MRKAVLWLIILVLAGASGAAYAEPKDNQEDDFDAAKGKSGGFQDLIPLPTLYLSEREPILDRFLSLNVNFYAGGYLFDPDQIYQHTWTLGFRVGLQLWFGLEVEGSYGGSVVKIDRAAALRTGLISNNSRLYDADRNRRIQFWHVDVLWHPYEWPKWHSGWGTMLPYIKLGFGGIIQFPPLMWDQENNRYIGGGRDSDPTLNFGAGLKYWLPWWDFVGVRFDANFAVLAGFGDSPFDNASQAGSVNSELTGGIFGHFDIIGMLEPKKEKKKEGPVDSDGDGIPDHLDKCPNEPGPPSNDGCPVKAKAKVEDKDGDGIPDAEDECPDKPGPAATKGCPDKDGDGVPDHLDKCPDVAGEKKWDGCPDRDGDGIPDHLDKCPDVAGPGTKDGCPVGDPKEEKKKEIIKQFSGTLEGINFITGKATLTEDSKKVLDAVAEQLKEYPALKVTIEGHTDNVGNPATNKVLSQRRAESVRTYLIGKGCNADNIKAVGFGQEKPVADNKTKEGKAKNRRIEFKITE